MQKMISSHYKTLTLLSFVLIGCTYAENNNAFKEIAVRPGGIARAESVEAVCLAYFLLFLSRSTVLPAFFNTPAKVEQAK